MTTSAWIFLAFWLGLVLGVGLGVAYQAWYGKQFKKPKLRRWAASLNIRKQAIPLGFGVRFRKPDPKEIRRTIWQTPRPHAGGPRLKHDDLERYVRAREKKGMTFRAACYAARDAGLFKGVEDSVDFRREMRVLKRRMDRHKIRGS